MKNISKISYLAVGITSVLIFSGCGKVAIDPNPPVQNVKMEQGTQAQVTSTPTIESSQEKVQVTSANWREHDAELAKQVDDGSFKGAINTDPATSTVHYIDFKNGFEVDLPYNPNWGIKNLVPVPYEATTTQVDFGPLVVICMGSCETGRDYQLTVLPHTKTAVEITTELRDNASTTKKIMVGNITVLDKYPTGDTDCISVNLEFTINNHTYNLNSSCFGNAASDRETLVNVIKSMKFFDKIVLNEKNLDQILENGVCHPKFRTDAPNSLVPYRNIDKGIEMSIPYNKNWTYGVMVLAPYFDDSEHGYIYFGPAFPLYSSGAGCDIERMYKFSFLPLTSVDKITAQVKEGVQMNNQKIEIQKKVIGNLSVVEIDFSELTDRPNFPKHRDTYIFGKKYTYEIENYGHIPPVEEVEKIISTIKFI